MVLTIIIFIIILSLLVFVHELGHFWVARRLGVRAEEFGFGFPPRAIGLQILKGQQVKKVAVTEKIDISIDRLQNESDQTIVKETIIDQQQEIDTVVPVKKWKIIKGGKEINYKSDEVGFKKSTIYSLNWVPLGGFVKIKGEDGENEKETDSFANKKIWQRTVILLSGVTMNILLAMLLVGIGFMIGLPQVIDGPIRGARILNKQIQVIEVLPDLPAAKNEIKIGDILMSVNDKTFSSTDELQEFVASQTGKQLIYKIKRGQEEFLKSIMPEIMSETGKGGIGIGITQTGLVRYGFFNALWQGIKNTMLLTWAIIAAFYGLFKNIFTGHGIGAEISGPVGIAVLTGQVAQMGFIYLLQFTAILSINLAIINAFPFPALDGGRVLFLIIEKIKGSPVKKEIEGLVHNIGFALLMLLVLFVTFKDITRYTDIFKNLWSRIIG